MSQPNAQIAQLQAQLAQLQQENTELRTSLEACQLEVRSHSTKNLQPIKVAPSQAQFVRNRVSNSALEPRLLAATATAATALLTIAPLDAAVNAALQILGEALDTDRMTVIENFNPSDSSFVWWRILYEWTSPDAMPQITHLDLAQGSYEGMEEWYALLRQGQGISCLLEEMPEPFRSGQAALGVKALHAVPIFVEGKYWGVVGLDDCRKTMHRSLAALDVLKIVANCIGSAIQRDCAQQARIQAEQERAAELAKANEALKRSLDALATDPDLNRFIGHVLSIVAEQLDAPVSEYWSHSGKVAYLELSCWQGEIASHEQLARDPRTQGIEILPEIVSDEKLEQRRRHFVIDDLPGDPLQLDIFSALDFDLEAWCETHGVRRHLNVPLWLGEQTIGALTVYIPADRSFTQQQIELAYALAQQVTLAVQLTQLAEEAKEAAIAREQEQAAQERAAELAKANDALKQTVDVMVRELNLDNFLAQVLLVVNQHLDTPGSMLWLYDFEAGVINLHLACISDIIYRQELPSYGSSVHRTQFPITINGDAAHLIQGNPLVTIDLPEILDPALDAGTREWLRDHKVISVLRVPLSVGERVIGNLTIHKEDSEPFSVEKVELAKALGQQAALSIHITQLAEEAKQAAIAREQERAALERATALEKVNEVLRQRSHEVQRSYRILEATARATDALLTIQDFDQAVNTALQILGESLETDRTKVLESLLDDPSRPFSRHHNVLYEWTSPGTVRQLSHPHGQQVDTRERMEDFWERFLQTNGFGGLLEEWDETLHAAFQLLEVKSLYVVPIRVNGQWWGILAFDDCREAKDRPQAEMAVLQTVANCIGSAIQRQRMQRAREEAERQVLLEQEQAAQERAVALATANIALQAEVIERDRAERSARGQAEALVRMLTAFAAAPVLDNFLGIVLQAIVEQIGGHSGGIWLYDDCQNTSILHLNYEDGQIQQGSQITRPGTKPDFLKQWDRDYLSALKQQKLLIQDRRQSIDSPAYADYHTYNQQRGIKMILVVALFFGETFLGNITLRCTDYRDCKPEELALIQALAQQAALVIQLTRLAEQSKQAAILEERNRMAREIHDTLAQSFTSIRMQLEAAIRLLNCKPEQAQACITFAQELAKSGLAEARRSVWALQPEAEDYRHLSTTLERLAAQQTAETSIQVEVVIIGTPYALPPDVGMNLLRIGQEALNNALHHASAQTMLTLTYDPHQVQLQIQDDGQGFDPQLESSGGFGLISMKQRSDRLGGTFTIKSQPGHGTEVRVTVPI